MHCPSVGTVAVGLMALMLPLGVASASQGRLISRDEALAAVFPGAVVEAERVFLTEQQMAEVAEIAGVEIESGLVARYVATLGDAVMGRAYVDTHVVRTKRERWLRQYARRRLDDDLALQRAIRPIAGATLTANATNAAVRRVLAIDRILEAGH